MKKTLFAFSMIAAAGCANKTASNVANTDGVTNAAPSSDRLVAQCSESNPVSKASTTFTLKTDKPMNSMNIDDAAGKLVTQGGMAKFIMTSNFTCKRTANPASKQLVFSTLWSCESIPNVAGDNVVTKMLISLDPANSGAHKYNANFVYPNGLKRVIACDVVSM